MRAEIAVLPGDGIGPEVIDAALEVLHAVAKRHSHQFVEQRCLIGGAAIDASGEALPAATAAKSLCFGVIERMRRAIGLSEVQASNARCADPKATARAIPGVFVR